MPVPPLANSFEGGSDGTLITTANSGGASGDAFDALGSTAGEGPTFSSTNPHSGSTLGMKVVDATAPRYVRWSNLGGLSSNTYFRLYAYLPALPTTQNHWFMDVQNATGFLTALVFRSLDGKVGGSVAASLNSGLTGTSVVPTATQVRIELRVLPSLTVGEIEWRLYTSAESTTIADTKSMTGQVLQDSITLVRFGVTSTPLPTTPYSSYYDDLAVSTAGWLGPTTANKIKSGVGVIGP